MKQKAAFEEMELVLNELNEQFSSIKNNETRIPQIEIDIMMANMRKLYESIGHLKMPKELQYNEEPLNIVSEVEETIKRETKEEPITKTEQTSNEETALFDEDLAYEKVTNDFLEEIEILEEKAKSKLEEIKVKPTHNQTEAPKTKSSKPSLLLQFEDEIFSVNESIAQKGEDKSVVKKLSNTRIENLKSAIGINDKFYFINELFKGNSQAYEDVIYTLNNFKRFDDAIQYFSTLKFRYDWNTEAEAYKKLIHFLERKFLEMHA